MFSKIISTILIYTIFCNSLFAQSAGEQKLVNALSGLSFLARSNKVTENELGRFIESNKNELDKHQLTAKFQKLVDLMSKMKNCGKVQMNFDFANPFLQKIEPCNGGVNLNISSLDQLFSSLDKIQNEMNGDKNSIDQEKFKKLADKVYQEQRRMYMGAAYLAYSKYREPGISFENFLKTWAIKDPNLNKFNNSNTSAHGYYPVPPLGNMNGFYPVSPIDNMYENMNKLTTQDKEWSEKLEEAARIDQKKFPNPKENIKELSKKSSEQLREVYKDHQALEEISRAQNEFEMTINQLRGVIRSKDDKADLIQARALEDPFEQGFDILKITSQNGLNNPNWQGRDILKGHAQSELDHPFDRLRAGMEKERKFQEGVRFDVAHSPILAYYVSEIQKNNEDVIILDDSLSKNGTPLNYKNIESRSPVFFLKKFGLKEEADDRLKYSGLEYIANNFKGKKVITVTEIMKMHQELMGQKGLLGDELTKARSNMSKNWLSSYENLQESRHAFNQTDGRLLKISANAGENKGGLTIFAGDRKRLNIAENKIYKLKRDEVEKIDDFYGLGPSKADIKDTTADTLLEVFLDQSRKLMRKVSENYYGQSPSEFLQDTIYYHPALVNKIIAEDPSLAGVVCALPAMKTKDEARSKRNKEIYDNVTMCLGIAAIFLSAGVAAPLALGLGVGTIAYNAALGADSYKNYDYANKIYNTTGQLKGKESSSAEAEINGYYKESMTYFQEAVVDGALTPLQINAFMKVLPSVKNDAQVWKKLRSNPLAIKDFFQLLSLQQAKDLGISKLQGELKNFAKDSVKED